jgi:hypothetical protein
MMSHFIYAIPPLILHLMQWLAMKTNYPVFLAQEKQWSKVSRSSMKAELAAEPIPKDGHC